MTTLTVIKFKDTIELLYPNNNTLATLPYNSGKEEVIVQGIYQTIISEMDKNCQLKEEIFNCNYSECR